MDAQTTPQRPRYSFWLLASIPLALFLDVWVVGFARFAYCGLAYCLNHPGDVVTSVACLAVAGFVMFLAIALPPWIPDWRRPLIAAAAGVLIAVVGGVYAFQPL